jgi:hypothetical protein
MDDSFLDEVLKKVSRPALHYYEVLEASYDYEEAITKLKPAVNYLLDHGYITSRNVGSQKYLDISPKGIRLLQEGGFIQVTKDKKDLRLYAKESRDYARWAFIVAILGLIVGLLTLIRPLSKV